MKRLISVLVLVVVAGCLSGCVSEGQGWALNVRTGGITIDWTAKPNSVGEYYNVATFDPQVWRSFSEWWSDKDEAGRDLIKKDIDLIMRWMREGDDEYETVKRLYDLIVKYEGAKDDTGGGVDGDVPQPVVP